MGISKYGLIAFAASLIVAAGTAFAQLSAPSSATAITDDDCVAAWGRADASSSCTTVVLNAEADYPGGSLVNRCAIKANCASVPDGAHDTFSDYHGGPDGAETLVNCSGTLSLTSC